MPDPNRQYAGFRSMERGMDGGKSASLIGQNQCAFASNLTFRGAYPRTRPPFANLLWTFASDLVEGNWSGKFQGWQWYDGETGYSGWLISRGGYLFFLNIDTLILTDVTPQTPVVTTAAFTVPALNGIVNITLNTNDALVAGTPVVIDGGTYTTNSTASTPTPFTYTGGAAGATVVTGAEVQDANGDPLIAHFPNPANYDMVYMFQAETYMIVMGGQHKTIIFDGSMARQATIKEIPPGVLGTYGWGRIWVTLPNQREFVAGDIVLGNGSRDDVLDFTENTYLNGGGSFGVPYNAGPITSMQFLATQDNSLGMGPLIIGTTNMIFSVNAPVDRTIWQNLQSPIQTISLLDYGTQGPRNTVSVNSDIWYRSLDGFRSFMVYRRAFGQPGNVPMSREVEPVLKFDDPSLLFYGSGVLFDNRLMMTISPERTPNGIQHLGLVNINFDLISDLGSKTAPAWEGIWTGLNILQLSKGRINGTERAFAIVNGENDIEIWEFLKDGAADRFTVAGEGVIAPTITRTAIAAVLETRSESYELPFALKTLYMGELLIDEITDDVAITIKFRPDQYPAWVTWKTVNLCATVKQCAPPTPGAYSCSIWQQNAKQYAVSLKLPQPPETCNEANQATRAQIRLGYEFQFRLEITGTCRIRAFKTTAKLRSDTTEGSCPAEVECTSFVNCETAMFGYRSDGT